jgi:hypothetical protein
MIARAVYFLVDLEFRDDLQVGVAVPGCVEADHEILALTGRRFRRDHGDELAGHGMLQLDRVPKPHGLPGKLLHSRPFETKNFRGGNEVQSTRAL